MVSGSPLQETHWLSGEIALRMLPSARWSRPSAWKPGWVVLKPRSMTSSTSCPGRSRQLAGTVPVAWTHRVRQGAPQASPTLRGRYSWAAASAKGTGSSGTSQPVRARAWLTGWTAGRTRSCRRRRARCSVMVAEVCMVQVPFGLSP